MEKKDTDMAAKPIKTRFQSATRISGDVPESHLRFLSDVPIFDNLPENWNSTDFYSDLIRSLLEPDVVQTGRIICLVSVKPSVSNYMGVLHGGAVAAVAEMVAIACARTVVAEDKAIFLAEFSISYLSVAPANTKLIVDGSVIRSGRNLTVIAIQFIPKETRKLIYTCRATFYHMPVANL